MKCRLLYLDTAKTFAPVVSIRSHLSENRSPVSETKKKKKKKKDKGKNSKRIFVLPIYTATTKAILNRIFVINTTKYNYYYDIANK